MTTLTFLWVALSSLASPATCKLLWASAYAGGACGLAGAIRWAFRAGEGG